MPKRGGRKPAAKQSKTRVTKTAKLTQRDRAADYEKIPGDPARRWRKKGGRKVISRRQHDVLLAREGVPKQAVPTQFSREATTRYWNFTRAWAKAEGVSARDASRSQEFKRDLEAFRKSKDNTPTGPRARFLVKLGWRDAKAKWNVGETPRRLRSRGRKAA
jgi:hypothetical protein